MIDKKVSLAVEQDGLRDLIEHVVKTVLRAEASARLPDDGRMAYSESEAAKMLGMQPWQLRDERLKGRVSASRVLGRKIRYTKSDLAGYLGSARVGEG